MNGEQEPAVASSTELHGVSSPGGADWRTYVDFGGYVPTHTSCGQVVTREQVTWIPDEVTCFKCIVAHARRRGGQ